MGPKKGREYVDKTVGIALTKVLGREVRYNEVPLQTFDQ